MQVQYGYRNGGRAVNGLDDIFIACLSLGSFIQNSSKDGCLKLIDICRKYGGKLTSSELMIEDIGMIKNKLNAIIGILMKGMYEQKDFNAIDQFVKELMTSKTTVDKSDFRSILGI